MILPKCRALQQYEQNRKEIDRRGTTSPQEEESLLCTATINNTKKSLEIPGVETLQEKKKQKQNGESWV